MYDYNGKLYSSLNANFMRANCSLVTYQPHRANLIEKKNRSLKDTTKALLKGPQNDFRKLPSIYVFSYFLFGFEGRMWDLIVSVPDHCLSFYFRKMRIETRGQKLSQLYHLQIDAAETSGTILVMD